MRIYLAFPGRGNVAVADSRIWLLHVHPALVEMGHEVALFDEDFAVLLGGGLTANEREAWRTRFSEKLLAAIRARHAERPIEVFLSYFYASCVHPDVVRDIRAMGIVTVNFSCNNVHQFHTVRDLAPLYDYCMVPERAALPRFRAVGARPVHVQMGANPHLFKPMGLPKVYPVTFIGAKYADRLDFIAALSGDGVGVRVWGAGWKAESVADLARGGQRAWRLGGMRRLARGAANRIGEWRRRRIVDRIAAPPVSDQEMVRIYNQSAIALNFSKAIDDHSHGTYVRHIRLRDFEVPMAGAFYLAEYSEELPEYYEIDSEVVSFETARELVDKARYYLSHDAARERVAAAGCRRARSEHTWAHRFGKLFREIGVG
jgi:spore maturation protein CgeB